MSTAKCVSLLAGQLNCGFAQSCSCGRPSLPRLAARRSGLQAALLDGLSDNGTEPPDLIEDLTVAEYGPDGKSLWSGRAVVPVEGEAEPGSEVAQFPAKRIAFSDHLGYLIQGEECLRGAVHGPAVFTRFPEELNLITFVRITARCRILGGGHVEIFNPEVPVSGIDVDHDGGLIGQAGEVVEKFADGQHGRRMAWAARPRRLRPI